MAPLEEMYFQPEAESAICVQSFDDSLNSAIRTTYRISLRSSSLFMPRYPSTRVVYFRDTLKRTSARVTGRSIAQPLMARNAHEAAEAGCDDVVDVVQQ